MEKCEILKVRQVTISWYIKPCFSSDDGLLCEGTTPVSNWSNEVAVTLDNFTGITRDINNSNQNYTFDITALFQGVNESNGLEIPDRE